MNANQHQILAAALICAAIFPMIKSVSVAVAGRELAAWAWGTVAYVLFFGGFFLAAEVSSG